MPGLDRLAAARNFLFQPGDAAFQLMRRPGGDIFTKHNIGEFFARLVRFHDFDFNASGLFSKCVFAAASVGLVCVRRHTEGKA